jgi:hypothetical protein
VLHKWLVKQEASRITSNIRIVFSEYRTEWAYSSLAALKKIGLVRQLDGRLPRYIGIAGRLNSLLPNFGRHDDGGQRSPPSSVSYWKLTAAFTPRGRSAT